MAFRHAQAALEADLAASFWRLYSVFFPSLRAQRKDMGKNG
jgi:hypothetical protein